MFKKLFVVITVLAMGFSLALAKDIYFIEKTGDGVTPADASLIPADNYTISNTSVAVIVTSTTYTNERGGINPAPVAQPCMVYGVIVSSEGPTTLYAVLRDSNTASSALTQLVCPPLYKNLANGGTPTVYTFNPPLKVKNNLSFAIGPAGLNGGSGVLPTGFVTVIYRRSGQK